MKSDRTQFDDVKAVTDKLKKKEVLRDMCSSDEDVITLSVDSEDVDDTDTAA